MRHVLVSAILLFTTVLGACGKEPAPDEGKALDWPAFVQQFEEDWFEAHPMMAFSAGRKEFAGRFPDWSANGIAAEIARLKAVAGRPGLSPPMTSARRSASSATTCSRSSTATYSGSSRPNGRFAIRRSISTGTSTC